MSENLLLERRCPDCGEVKQEYIKRPDNLEMICLECFDNQYCMCDACEYYAYRDGFIFVGGYAFCCEGCANDRNFYCCNDCDDWIDTRNHDYWNYSGGVICQNCRDNYVMCNRCDNLVHADDSQYDEEENCDYCEHCYSRRRSSLIKNHDYKPDYNFIQMYWDKQPLYLGIELEVECGQYPRGEKASEIITWLKNKKISDYVLLKDDGSLTNGIEIVFHPATLEALNQKFPMRSFLSYLQDIHLTSHQSGNCGLHVHASKRHMRDVDLYKSKLFFYRCKHYLIKFSARNNNDGALNYCRFDRYEPPLMNTEQEYGRYSALNLFSSEDTIEFRLFRGTLIYDRFQASLQFTDAFMNYIPKIGVGFLKNGMSSQIWQNFIKYTAKENRHQQFIKYVIKKGLV